MEAMDLRGENQVVARSNIGTAFYLFNHQAGGHKPFLRSALGEVCKPAIPLELHFYQSLDSRYPQLKRFVPPFLGVITVDLHPMTPADAGASTIVDNESAESIGSASDAKRSSPMDDGDEDGEDGSDDDTADTTAGITVDDQLDALDLQSPVNTGAAATPSTPNLNAQSKKRRLGDQSASHDQSMVGSASYSAKLWKKERSKSLISRKNSAHLQRGPSSSYREYLVLADLTLKYSRPCVLDIKMGTRQHGEDAPPAKVKSHSAKCAATTSLALGLRVCGMQIYDAIEQRYILWDKHWGRQLKEADIEPALATYLSNGTGIHQESLRSLQRKLVDLEDVIKQTTGVRFWGSSLLLIYEGDLQRGTRREDVHLIDFAHCQMTNAPNSPDDGLLLGLRNIIQYLSNTLESHTSSVSPY